MVAIYKDSIIRIFESRWNIILYTSFLGIILLPYMKGMANHFNLGIIAVGLGARTGILANIFIASILVCSVFGPNNSLWYKFLNFKWINFIGILSYSLYLWQQFFIHNSQYWVNQIPQNLICLSLFACCSYYLIERPFLKLKVKFTSQKTEMITVKKAVSG